MKRLTLATLGLASLLATGCGDDAPAPSGPPTLAPARKKAEVAAPAVIATQIDYVYNSINKRDPFRGTFMDTRQERGGDAAAGGTAPCEDPLCQFDLDELAVVAVVSGDANPLAMVEDRKGVGYIVRRNTKIGKGGGKVTQVLRECIVVTSFVSGGADGKPIAKKDELCVNASDAKTQPALDLLRNKEFSQ